jgi:hypothetical protein
MLIATGPAAPASWKLCRAAIRMRDGQGSCRQPRVRFFGLRRAGAQHPEEDDLAPEGAAVPIGGIAEVGQVVELLLARDRSLRVDVRTLSHLIPGERNAQHLVRLVALLDCDRRDQHLALRQPMPRLDDEVANHPGLVVDIQVVDLPDWSIRRPDALVLEVFRVAQHLRTLSWLEGGGFMRGVQCDAAIG